MQADIVLLLVSLHGRLDGLSGIVQAALDGAFGDALDLSDLLHGHLIEISQQQGAALLLGQLRDHGLDRLAEVRSVHGLIGDELRPVLLQGIEGRVAVLLLIQQHIPPLAEVGGAFVIGDLLAPGDEGQGLFQFVNRFQDLHEGILGQVRRQLRVLVHSLQDMIIDIVVKGIIQLSRGAVLTALHGRHQRDQLLPFHHKGLPSSFSFSSVL